MQTVEVFDSETLQWQSMSSMNQARHSHICTSFGAEGGAIVAGGKCGVKLLRSVEVYSPAQNCWSKVKDLPVPLAFASACLCTDGRCAVLGGWNGKEQLDTVYVYPKPAKCSEIAPADAGPERDEVVEASVAAAEATDTSDNQCSLGGWRKLAAMATPAAEFSVVSDRSFGTVVIRTSESTKEVLVEPLRMPAFPVHEQQRMARADAAQDTDHSGHISAWATAENVRGRATVTSTTTLGSDEAKGALQIMRRLPHSETLPVQLQYCVAACGMACPPEPMPTAEEIAAQRAKC